MDLFDMNELPGIQPLPKRAAELLQHMAAPPRLIAHHLLVHDVALRIIDGVQRTWPALPLDKDTIAFGAATHDIGKVVHREELRVPGSQHEEEGETILIHQGVEPALARFTVTHAQWQNKPLITLEDLIVALADTIWKGKRIEQLEQSITERVIQQTRAEYWDTLIKLSDMIEDISAGAEQKLAWHGQFPVE